MAVVFDAEVLSRAERIPAQFVWPAEERPAGGGVEEMDIPVVDLAGFLRGGGELPRGVAEACERHGFFQVVGHGVGAALIAEAYRCCDAFYARPLAEKQRARRRPGESHGYASSFTDRFDASLPWKETLSFHCPASPAPGSGRAVADYFVGVLGEEYRHMGYVTSVSSVPASKPLHSVLGPIIKILLKFLQAKRNQNADAKLVNSCKILFLISLSLQTERCISVISVAKRSLTLTLCA